MSLVNIAVYFTDGKIDGPPFNVPEYKKSYLDFFKYAVGRNADLQFFVVRGDSYLGEGIFVKGEKFDPEKGELVDYAGKIEADIIYNKGDLLTSTADSANILNSPKFNRLCKDKMRTALLFPKYSPQTVEVRSKKEVKKACELVDSEKIVLKPLDGQEGKGVIVTDRDGIADLQDEFDQTHILQEFLDTSCGIDGLIEGIHDMRVLLMNGEIVQVYVRTPGDGKLIANVSKGGSLKEIGVEDLPEDIVEIVKMVDEKLKRYHPRIYSIDFGYTKDGPKIFELNSQPGLPYPQWTKYYNKWHEALFDTLVSGLKK